MTISNNIKSSIEKSSWIRKMFEEGARLKAQFGDDNVFDGAYILDQSRQIFEEVINIGSLNSHTAFHNNDSK